MQEEEEQLMEERKKRKEDKKKKEAAQKKVCWALKKVLVDYVFSSLVNIVTSVVTQVFSF